MTHPADSLSASPPRGRGLVALFAERAVRDLRFGVRSLARSRTFSAVAVLSLALGIGAATAIFSLVDSILVRPLPYAQADRLVVVREMVPKAGRIYPDLPANPQHFRIWQQHARSLADW